MATESPRSTERRLGTCWNCGCDMRREQRICGRCGATRVPTVRRSWLELDDGSAPEPAGATRSFASDRPVAGSRSGAPGLADLRYSDTGAWNYYSEEPSAYATAAADHAFPEMPATTPVDPPRVWLRDTQGWRRHEPAAAARERGASIGERLANMLFALGFGIAGGVIGGGIWYAVVMTVHIEFGPCAVLMGYLIGRGVALGSERRHLVSTLLAMILTTGGWVILTAMLLAQDVVYTPLDITFLLASLAFAIVPTRLLPRRES